MSEEDARQAAYDRWNTTRSFVAPKAETFEAGFEAGRDYQRQQAPADVNADAELVATYRQWAQKLLDVSEYVGTDREDAARWQCAFGCGGYSYESLYSVDPYKRTPPASHDWHAASCQVRALASDLARAGQRSAVVGETGK